jgi:hypothetical protein
LPFLPGLLIAPVGLYIRAHLDETLDSNATESHPLATLFTDNWLRVFPAV